MRIYIRSIITVLILGFIHAAIAANASMSMTPQQQMIYQAAPDEGLLGIAVYYSKMDNKLLNQVMRFKYNMDNTPLYSGEVNYRLSTQNPLSQFFDQFGARFEVNGNFTYEDDPVGSIYEFTPYFNVRWINFPWNRYLTTTFAIGEGVSYATSLPYRERRDHDITINGRRFENYLMFEATASLPSRPDWQLIYRVHHRSGVFGMYDSSNSGSTAVGLGVRHYFNWT